MSERIVTFRFKGCPTTEEMAADMKRIAAWTQWTGDAEMPSRLEFHSTQTRVSHFPMKPVRFTREDADALLVTLELVDAIVCAKPADPNAVKVRPVKEQRVSHAAIVPASPDQVRPALRFLLSDESRKEGHEFYRRLEWLRGPRQWALKRTAASLDTDFPHVARLDDVLGGAVRRILVEAADLPVDPEGHMPAWVSIGVLIANGHPHRLETYRHEGRTRDGEIERCLKFIESARPVPVDDCPF